MITVTCIHLTVARKRKFGVPTLYISIIMARTTLDAVDGHDTEALCVVEGVKTCRGGKI